MPYAFSFGDTFVHSQEKKRDREHEAEQQRLNRALERFRVNVLDENQDQELAQRGAIAERDFGLQEQGMGMEFMFRNREQRQRAMDALRNFGLQKEQNDISRIHANNAGSGASAAWARFQWEKDQMNAFDSDATALGQAPELAPMNGGPSLMRQLGGGWIGEAASAITGIPLPHERLNEESVNKYVTNLSARSLQLHGMPFMRRQRVIQAMGQQEAMRIGQAIEAVRQSDLTSAAKKKALADLDRQFSVWTNGMSYDQVRSAGEAPKE